jgi:site-specific DNA-methyltransferase (adenine-specific)
MGKLLPAHYSLLYFTKPGGSSKVNLENDQYIDSRDYCLRNSCIKKRKKLGNDRKEQLTDVWKDVHRIKHKKDRDHHPCQLPTKLMERIIKIFSNKGDLIFDPFGGAGTTAVAAKLLNRDFIVTELDEKYVEIAQKNLAKIKTNLYGDFIYERGSVIKLQVNGVPRKQVEKTYMTLCFSNNRTYSEEELRLVSPSTYDLVKNYTGDFNKLISATKRMMDAKSLTLGF